MNFLVICLRLGAPWDCAQGLLPASSFGGGAGSFVGTVWHQRWDPSFPQAERDPTPDLSCSVR